MFKLLKYNMYNTGTQLYCALYDLKQHLKTNGWTVKCSGTGNLGLYSDSSDVITSYSYMNGNGAWFVIKSPTYQDISREILFQWNSTAKTFNIYYSKDGLFSGGSASSAATALDQIIVASNEKIFTDGYNCKFIIGSGDIDDAYSFYITGYSDSYPNESLGLFAFDCLKKTSYLEIEPYIFWKCSKLTTLNIISQAYGYMAFGSPSQLWGQLSIFYFGSPNNVGLEKASKTGYGKIDILPIFVGRSLGFSLPRGIKGQSRILKWHSVNDDRQPLTASISSFQDSLILDNVLLPWDNTGIVK
jgi:hypothetical protein